MDAVAAGFGPRQFDGMRTPAGRPVIVTGANSGVGFSVSRLLVEAGLHVVMICRNEERGRRAIAALTTAGPGTASLEIADLAELSQVRELGSRLSTLGPIEALVNNAGVWRNRLERNSTGHEVTMATNHLSHFLLTGLVLDQVLAGGRRIVNVSSEAHRSGKLDRAPLGEIMTGEAWKGGLQAYSDSKQANVLFTSELMRRYDERGLIANSLHPGVLSTMIWNKNRGPVSLLLRLFKVAMKPPDVGGRAVMRLLRDPDLADVSDAYFNVEKRSRAEPAALDEHMAGTLWEYSEAVARA